jgi:hypothetical protein
MKEPSLASILLICLSACNDKTEKNKTPSTGGLSSGQALSTFKLPEDSNRISGSRTKRSLILLRNGC